MRLQLSLHEAVFVFGAADGGIAKINDHPLFWVLIDDDAFSAELFIRSVHEAGGPPVRHMADPDAARLNVSASLDDCKADWPSLVIVDLKAHSRAPVDFLAGLRPWAVARGLPLLALVPPVDRAARQALLDAGALAVFFRQAERAAYRREVAAMLNFQARHQCLDAVGM